MRTSKVILGLIVIIALGVMSLELNYLFTPMEPGFGTEKSVVVPAGSTTKDIADILYIQGLIKNKMLFRAVIEYKGLDGRLKAGEYVLNTAMTSSEIVDYLVSGKQVTHSFTVPEGFTVEQIAELLESKHLVDKDAFLKAAQRQDLIKEFLMLDETTSPEQPLEGYLFPDTYRVPRTTTEEHIVELMVSRFKEVMNQELRKRAEDIGLSVHQVVTLASIVEKEAMVDFERPLIAGVYQNRLKKGMKLDADPTVLYALKRTSGLLTLKDLEVYSPYNTYKRVGLPPGPIANPGLSSLKAALYPADGDFLYFVSKNDGTHSFNATFDAHSRDVRKYQMNK